MPDPDCPLTFTNSETIKRLRARVAELDDQLAQGKAMYDAEVAETDTLKLRLVAATGTSYCQDLRIQDLIQDKANLESEIHSAAEPWLVQSAMLDSVNKERDRLKEAVFAALEECRDIHSTANSVASILMKSVIY